MEQAREMARVFVRNPFKIRQIVCSPMLRTVQTADFIHDVMSVKLRTASLVKARDFGKWESERWSNINDDSLDPPGGESRAAFEARVYEGVCKILAGPAPVLMVSHPEVGEALFSRITGERMRLGPAEAFRIRADAAGKKWVLEKLNLISK